MKKLFTLLLLTLTAFTLKSTAQSTSCNAGFSFTVSGFTAHFSPVIVGDSMNTHHEWFFNDGFSSTAVAPSHIYSAAGTYHVKHKITRTLNGTVPCVDSVFHDVVILQPLNCSVHASFIHQSANQQNIVYFTNTSTSTTPVLSNSWTFGDGTSSSDPNPVHTYANAGAYTVCLKVMADGGCSDSTCSTVIISPLTPPPCTLHAGFTSQSAIGSANGIYFSNTSTPAGDVHYSFWHFGDGHTATVIGNAPVYHQYDNAGTYTVCLTVKRDSACSDSICHTVIVVTPPPPVCNLHAKFSYQRDSLHPNIVYFTNLSTPVGDVHQSKWIFGDGTFAYTFNATHTYSASGVYHVCLIVSKDSSCQRDTCMYVQIQVPPPPSCNLVANFVWNVDSVQINKIHFTNLSVPLSPSDSIRWNFGDGSTSLDVNPIHVYSAPGSYTVCLRVKKNNASGTSICVKEICKVVIVQSTCVLHADFTSHADSLNHLKIYFNNLSTPASSVTHVQWTFGDGTSSSSWSPDHIYAQAGTYHVCLNITSGAGCYSSICKDVVVVEPINCLDISKFNFTHSTNNCLEFNFQPVTVNSTWHYQWTFGDGTTSSAISPAHVYAQPGNYTVCLTTIRSNTCASTTCKPLSTGLCFSCNNVWVKYSYIRDPFMPNKLYFHGLSNYQINSETWTFTRISPVSTTPPVVLHQFDPVYTFTEPGYYRVCLNAVTYGGCVKEYCEVIYIGQTIGTGCTLAATPNPATTNVSVTVVETAPEVIHVTIFNSLNIIVKQQDQQGFVGNNVVTINVSNLVPGPYTMRIVYGNHICYSHFVKQ